MPELQAEINAQDQQAIRQSVRELCRDFPDAYWRKIDKAEEYPEEFVKAVTKSGYLAALIPEEYGGAGMGITEASIIEGGKALRLAWSDGQSARFHAILVPPRPRRWAISWRPIRAPPARACST